MFKSPLIFLCSSCWGSVLMCLWTFCSTSLKFTFCTAWLLPNSYLDCCPSMSVNSLPEPDPIFASMSVHKRHVCLSSVKGAEGHVWKRNLNKRLFLFEIITDKLLSLSWSQICWMKGGSERCYGDSLLPERSSFVE